MRGGTSPSPTLSSQITFIIKFILKDFGCKYMNDKLYIQI